MPGKPWTPKYLTELLDPPWVDVAAAPYNGSLTALITAIGATKTDVLINSTATLTANTVIPENLRILVTKKGIVSQGVYNLTNNGTMHHSGDVTGSGAFTNAGVFTAHGGVFNLSGAIAAGGSFGVVGAYQVFVGSGVVSGLREARVEWFGVNTVPGTTDVSAAAQKAASALATSGRLVIQDTYLLANIALKADTTVEGSGTLKLKVLASLDFSPIFYLTGANVKFIGALTFDGNRANQPADGFSDSFNTGANGKGKSNRAAIKADNFGTGYTISNLDVIGCTFKNMWGASIATRDASHVNITNNVFQDNNFEGAFLYTGGVVRNTDARVVNNSFTNLTSGDGSVEANAATISYYDSAIVTANICKSVARNMVKFEYCNDVDCQTNIIDTNIVANFNAIQMQSSGSKANISGNIITNTGQGIKIEAGTFSQLVIANNIIDTTTGATGDGISLNTVSNVTVMNNQLYNIKRNGIFAYNGDNVKIADNNVSGQNANIGIGYSAYSASYSNIEISGNNVKGFVQSAVSNGVIDVARQSTYKITGLIVNNNNVDAGGATNRAINVSSDLSNSGTCFFNRVVGIIESASYNFFCRGNIASRVIAVESFERRMLPAATAAPTTGTYYATDVVYNSNPTAGSYLGWICVTGGTPGTWKGFGAIAA